jgi:small subunit ribosomal protein S7e
MFTALRKIKKQADEKPTELEQQVAQAVFDLEVNDKTVKSDLQLLQFTSAQEVVVGKDKTAVIVFVPVRQLKSWRKVQVRVVRELEKKFNGKQVLVIAQRKALSKPSSTFVKRPRARSLAEVQANLLIDIAYPVTIVGRRIRVRVDGSQHQRIFLDAKEKSNFESKLKTFSVVYRKLTGKHVTYEFLSQ